MAELEKVTKLDPFKSIRRKYELDSRFLKSLKFSDPFLPYPSLTVSFSQIQTLEEEGVELSKCPIGPATLEYCKREEVQQIFDVIKPYALAIVDQANDDNTKIAGIEIDGIKPDAKVKFFFVRKLSSGEFHNFDTKSVKTYLGPIDGSTNVLQADVRGYLEDLKLLALESFDENFNLKRTAPILAAILEAEDEEQETKELTGEALPI